jgi:Mn-containing catalase
MKLSEINRDKEEVNVSAATRCYRQALKNNADSVREYVRQVPMEDVRHIELLRNLVQRLDNPTEITDDEDESEEEFYESEEGIDENVAAEVQPQ